MTETLEQRRTRLLGPNVRLFYDHPPHLVRGQGTWVWDAAGGKYLDCYNNVPHVGHCHPHVTKATARQASLLNTRTRYLHEGILDYVERLIATFDAQITCAIMVCTGSEVNDVALRMAQAITARTGKIATDHTDHTYHGHPVAAVATSFDIMSAFRRVFRYFNTFGGNPVSCAAAGAVLDVLWEADLVLQTLDHVLTGL